MLEDRVRTIKSAPQKAGPILYWMNRDMRIHNNWAFYYAYQLAKQNNQQLIVGYNLMVNFEGGIKRHWETKLNILSEVQASLQKLNVPLQTWVDSNGKQTPELIHHFISKHKIATLVTDFSPLTIQVNWLTKLKELINIPIYQIDTHNIIPVWEASPKQEFAAYTIRPKIYKLLPKYLDSFPKLQPLKDKLNITINTDLAKLQSEKKITSDPYFTGNVNYTREKALKEARYFLENKLPNYALLRNNAMLDQQSNLSPYLHYGVICTQELVLLLLNKINKPLEEIIDFRKNKAKVEENKPLTLLDNAAAFLEELVIRKELSDNFCFYNTHYQNTKGFPEWAKKSLEKHTSDTREYLYSTKEFEFAKTHDKLWNAAQIEMLQTGKMHGYMRMYWAKKILEWTNNPEEAMQIAIYLNDKYELDGRDPNGYAGIAWSIGGVHDRAWFERNIFGQIRYMAKSGCDKKFNTKNYIDKFSLNKKLL